MNDLYQGNLEFSKIDLAISELNEIEEKFRELGVDKVVWDADDLNKMPPWKNNISSDIHNLAEYFWTSSGENIFTTMKRAFSEAKNEQINIQIVNL